MPPPSGLRAVRRQVLSRGGRRPPESGCCRGSTLLQAGKDLPDLNGAESDTRRCDRRGFADVEPAGQLFRVVLRIEDGYRDTAAAVWGEPVCSAGTSLAGQRRCVFL